MRRSTLTAKALAAAAARQPRIGRLCHFSPAALLAPSVVFATRIGAS
jgi:hypothetical protein